MGALGGSGFVITMVGGNGLGDGAVGVSGYKIMGVSDAVLSPGEVVGVDGLGGSGFVIMMAGANGLGDGAVGVSGYKIMGVSDAVPSPFTLGAVVGALQRLAGTVISTANTQSLGSLKKVCTESTSEDSTSSTVPKRCPPMASQ